MCCVQLTGNTGCKNDAKNRHLGTIAQLYRAVSLTKARIENRKKLVKLQYLLHMSPQYGELRPTSGWDPLAGLGHQFQKAYGPDKTPKIQHLIFQHLKSPELCGPGKSSENCAITFWSLKFIPKQQEAACMQLCDCWSNVVHIVSVSIV